jgi:hypothetical protein
MVQNGPGRGILLTMNEFFVSGDELLERFRQRGIETHLQSLRQVANLLR